MSTNELVQKSPQTDVYLEDVLIDAALLTSDRDGFDPKKYGTVRVVVPYPLLRVIFRTAPASHRLYNAWKLLMGPTHDGIDFSLERALKETNEDRDCVFGMPVPGEVEFGPPSQPRWGEREAFREFSDGVLTPALCAKRRNAWIRKYVSSLPDSEFKEWFNGIIPGERMRLDLSQIVAESNSHTKEFEEQYDVASWRLAIARRYARLFGAYEMIVEELDLETATASERMQRALFRDIRSNTRFVQPRGRYGRSYGWYVLRKYWMCAFGAFNWLWKAALRRKYAPSVFLADPANYDLPIIGDDVPISDNGDTLLMTLKDDVFESQEGAMEPAGPERVLGKHARSPSPEPTSTDDDSDLETPSTVRACKRMRRREAKGLEKGLEKGLWNVNRGLYFDTNCR